MSETNYFLQQSFFSLFYSSTLPQIHFHRLSPPIQVPRSLRSVQPSVGEKDKYRNSNGNGGNLQVFRCFRTRMPKALL